MSDPSHSRRLAREMAVQALYAVKVGGTTSTVACDDVLTRHPLTPENEAFFRGLVEGVSRNVPALDAVVDRFLARGWSVDRLALTDLLVLRLATYEIHHLPGMPPKVTITQAVELAKLFGSAESGRFVNGVLASVLADSDKAEWDPAREEQRETMEEEPRPVVEEEEADEAAQPETARFQVGAWVVKSDG
ncbi:MAG: transcription antitermination factor NusB [Fimbriimonadaceae bacterium]|nr:transcription antitermination factor NusB [Fimbriimonadaceae bacterium]